MKKHILFIASFLSFFSFSQTYYLEDFDGVGGPTAGGAGTYTFAPGFLLRNVDNRTPDAQVAYVNEAWERREDFAQNVSDSVAFSTSFYSPTGAADDFMWTPALTILPNTTLFWNGKAYDATYSDGYEVRIMTTPPTGGNAVLGNQVSNSTVIFSTAAENSTWTNRSVSLNTYAGQTVYIGFRNTSNDKFILVIDDIELRVINNFDLEVITPTQNPYTIAPANQLTTAQNFKLEAVIKNQGIQAMTNVALGCQVIKDGILETTVMSSSIPSLASGATSAAMTASYTPTSNGVYTFKYFPVATETDEATSNDTIQSAIPITVTDSEMARDNGIVVGQLGIGAGTVGYIGQVFNIENTTSLTSVNVYFNRGYVGKRLATAIYNTNGSGVPVTLLTSTDTLLYIDDSARMYTLPIHGGPLTLAPGKYGFMQIEFDSTLALGQTSAVFQNNTVFVQWAANGPNFTPVESFGVNFAKSYYLRPQFDICFGEIGGVLSSSNNSTCELANGDATITLEPGYSVEWEDSTTNTTITGLNSGFYTYTISNADCSFSDSVEITTTQIPDASLVSSTNPLCIGDSGQIEIGIQNGQAPYTVSWNIAGNSTILIAPAGTYTATITDAGGCTTSISGTLNDPAPIVANSSSTNSTCATCPDGSASVTPTGGTAPYSYLWSDGSTTGSITNALPGTYNVTITDANGCEMAASVTINFSSLGIDELLQFGVTVYPNPMTDFIKIESAKDAIESAQLIDNSGRLVLESTINSKVGTIETSQLAKGNYQLILKTGDQTFKVQVVK
ncbi:choice-of-anchor J domain-containing protein [Fluviicola taffensis]|uniref:T9SS-dependent choice-of-anchor J family protein n=1 Tax=Fluviicola taffensis TaxID=191579 RepID=UPI0031383AF8